MPGNYGFGPPGELDLEIVYKKTVTIKGVVYGGASKIQSNGTVSGGTFTLTLTLPDGTVETTEAIAWNASAAVVQAALLDLPSVKVGDVTAAGGALPTTAVTLTWAGNLEGLDPLALEADDTAITGANGEIEVVRVPQDLTGWTLGWVAKRELAASTDNDSDAAALMTKTPTVTDAANGAWSFTLAPADFPASLDGQVTTLFQELGGGTSASITYQLATGTLTIVPRVRRAAP